MYTGENNDTLPGPMWTGLYFTYNQETERTLYYLAPYLSLPAPSANVETGMVATCPASYAVMQAPAGTSSNSLTWPVCFLLSTGITNADASVLTSPFGYPYSSPFYRLPNKPDEPPKTMGQIVSPSTSWSATDADQQNAFAGGLYYPLLPSAKIHGNVRNEMFFDWHVEAQAN